MKKSIILIIVLIVYACTSTIVHIKNEQGRDINLKINQSDSISIDRGIDFDLNSNDTIE